MGLSTFGMLRAIQAALCALSVLAVSLDRHWESTAEDAEDQQF
jgi:hypothetical protein